MRISGHFGVFYRLSMEMYVLSYQVDFTVFRKESVALIPFVSLHSRHSISGADSLTPV